MYFFCLLHSSLIWTGFFRLTFNNNTSRCIDIVDNSLCCAGVHSCVSDLNVFNQQVSTVLPTLRKNRHKYELTSVLESKNQGNSMDKSQIAIVKASNVGQPGLICSTNPQPKLCVCALYHKLSREWSACLLWLYVQHWMHAVICTFLPIIWRTVQFE